MRKGIRMISFDHFSNLEIHPEWLLQLTWRPLWTLNALCGALCSCPGDHPCEGMPRVAAGAGLNPLEHLTPGSTAVAPTALQSACFFPARPVVPGLQGLSADRALAHMPPVLVVPPTRRPDVLAVGVRAGAPQPPPSHVLVVVVKRHAEQPAVPEVGKEQRELHEAQHRLEVGPYG